MSARLNWEKDGSDWPNRDCSRFVTAAGLDWHVQLAGSGPVMLLLHGTGASTHSWRDLIMPLAARFRVIAPDLPGHGFTSLPTSSDGLSLAGMASSISTLLAELDVRPDIAVGHSAGAAVLLRMALDHAIAPRLIISLNGALLPFGGLAGQIFPPMARLLVSNPFVPALMAWRGSDRGSVTRLIEGTGSSLDADGLKFYTRLFGNRGHVDATLRMMANWQLDGLVSDFSKLDQPLLLVAGERDKAVSPEEARRIRRLLPRSGFASLPGLGHLAHEERPAELVGLIARAADAGLAK
jgi:magnesium chelatase accessory protein